MRTQVDTAELARSVFRVADEEGQVQGSGFVVAPEWAVTCAHVVKNLQVVELRPHRSVRADPMPATVVARSAGALRGGGLWPFPDLALLRVDAHAWPCVLVDGQDPDQGQDCIAWGFARREEGVAEVGSPAALRFEGRDEDGFLRFKAGSVEPGLSGAPVVCPVKRAVVGVVTASREPGTALGGWAAPLSALLTGGAGVPAALAGMGITVSESNLAAVLADRMRWHRVLPVTDATELVDQQWAPFTLEWRSDPANLLVAQHGVVPYLFRDDALDAMERWCGQATAMALVQVTGRGGMGKTRFAVESCKRMSERGWIAGMWHGQPEGIVDLARVSWPRLLVVDYAEEVPPEALRSGLEMLRRHASQVSPVRVMLLGRPPVTGAPDMVDMLRQRPVATLQRILDASVEAPEYATEALDIDQRQILYREARASFARTWRRPDVAGSRGAEHVPDLRDERFGSPLEVTFEALDNMLTDEDAVVPGEGIPVERVLGHERRYWGAAPSLAGVDADVIELCVAMATIAGATGIEPAHDLLSATVSGLAGPSAHQTRQRIIAWLASTYSGQRYLNPLRPDRLGEALVLRILRAEADGGYELIKAILSLPDDDQLAQCLDMTARLAEGNPDIADTVTKVIADLFAGLVRRADDQQRGSRHAGHRLGLANGLLRFRDFGLAQAMARQVTAFQAADVASQRGFAAACATLASLSADAGRPEPAVWMYRQSEQIMRRLVDSRQRDHALARELTTYQVGLAGALRILGSRELDRTILDDAVLVCRAAVSLSGGSPGSLLADDATGALADALQARFELTADIADIDEAISLDRHGLSAAQMARLGAALRARFHRTGDIEDLREAVVALEQVVATSGQAGRTEHLSGLAGILLDVYECTGQESALTKALQVGREVVSITPSLDRRRASHLASLAGILRAWAHRTGDVAAAEEAVELGRRAVAASSADDPEPSGLVSDLGSSLRVAFELTGRRAMLEEAAQVGRHAVNAAATYHPHRPVYLSGLAAVLRDLSAHTGSIGPLVEAVAAEREAIALTPADHPNRGRYLSGLAATLRDLSEPSGTDETLAEAVATARTALVVTRIDHPDRAARLFRLGEMLRILSGRTGDPGPLDDAVTVHREAVSLAHADQPDSALYHLGLGLALRDLSDRFGDAAVREEAEQCFDLASQTTSAPALVRIAAYRAYAGLLAESARSSERALDTFDAAIRLLPQAIPPWLPLSDREHQVGRVAGLAAQAAAAAVTAGQPKRAVQLLELVRGIVVSEMPDARGSELSELTTRAPDLANQFDELRRQMWALEPVASRSFADRSVLPEGGPDASALAEVRREASSRWQILLNRIRALEGFGDFLRREPIDRLAEAASGGAVVYVYADTSRCDALILTDDDGGSIRVVHLDRLHHDVAREQVDRFRRAVANTQHEVADATSRQGSQYEISEILTWAWDTITEPILAELGYHATPVSGTDWPRIWWCPVGFLSYLPLHAAGHHHESRPADTVLDRVVSSYALTARTLGQAKAGSSAGTGHPMLIVAAVDPLGSHPLPGVIEEARRVAALVPAATVLQDPTHDAVVHALGEFSIAHFACMPFIELHDPGQNRLLLGANTPPLTMDEIGMLRLANAELVYLSAWDTAIAPAGAIDEALHFTAAFQMAGYRHVISAMMPIGDIVAARMSGNIYEFLTDRGSIPPDVTRSAYAVHHATRALRERYPTTPTVWAGYFHAGP